MNRRTKIILFMALALVISVLWPVAYMLRSTPPTNSTQGNETGPIVAVPVREYTAEVNATLRALEPSILAVAYSNAGSVSKLKEEISSWDGVSSVNITRSDSTDPNYLYRFDILVNVSNSSDLERIAFWLRKRLPMETKSVLSPANADFPDSAVFNDMKTGEKVRMELPKDIKVFAYPYTRPGNVTATIYIRKGVREEGIAILGSEFYIPPLENEFRNMTGNITSIDGAVILVNTSYVNATKLSQDWNATVSYDNETHILKVVVDPARLSEIKEKASSLGNITDAYYLASVEIPREIEIDGIKQELPKNVVSGVKVYKESGQVSFIVKITKAFGIVLGVNYGLEG